MEYNYNHMNIKTTLNEEMNNNITYKAFQSTLAGYEQGFQVRHIATFDISVCSIEDNVIDVFSRFPDFDQIPVQEEQCVVGVLERNGKPMGKAGEQMHRLNDGILVAAEEPLIHFLPLMIDPPFYRLVIEGTSANGIVTRSDLLKLPVRLLVFALVTNLELVMSDIINAQLPNDTDWFNLLSLGRQEKISDKKVFYTKKRMEPPLLELTDFCDKRTILKKHLKLPRKFASDLEEIENLRNTLSHAGTYVNDETDIKEFVSTMQSAQEWADSLVNYKVAE